MNKNACLQNVRKCLLCYILISVERLMWAALCLYFFVHILKELELALFVYIGSHVKKEYRVFANKFKLSWFFSF